MVNREINPPGIAPTAANYAHAVLAENPSKILHTSGIVATRTDGSIPDDIGGQAREIWSNIGAMLAEAGMKATDIVSIVTYVIPDQELSAVMAERDQFMGDHIAASTLIIVPTLAQPTWKMEIALVAAR